MLKQTVYSTLADRRGTTIVEFALAALAFLALIFGIVEFSRVLWTLNGLHLAVQQAARWAAVKGKSCSESDGTTESFAADVAGIGIGSSTFALSCCDIASKSNSGNKVVANYTIHLFVPYVQMSPRLIASDCYPRNAGT